MLKFITVIGILILSIGGYAQKPGCFIQESSIVISHRYFYLNNSSLDVHLLTSPFINKNEIIKSNKYRDFIIYYELSLKNITIMDSDNDGACLIVNLYEGSEFLKNMGYPSNYKPQKLRSNHLILDMVSAGSGNLVYRSWINYNSLKTPPGRNKDQFAISLLLKGFTIQPLAIE